MKLRYFGWEVLSSLTQVAVRSLNTSHLVSLLTASPLSSLIEERNWEYSVGWLQGYPIWCHQHRWSGTNSRWISACWGLGVQHNLLGQLVTTTASFECWNQRQLQAEISFLKSVLLLIVWYPLRTPWLRSSVTSLHCSWWYLFSWEFFAILKAGTSS